MIKKSSVLILTMFLSSTLSFAGTRYMPERPDPQVTPGELCDLKDSDFSGYRYEAKIPYCERNVSYETKVAIYEYYQVPKNIRQNYTIDHFIPLSIGGNNQPENLWPEHKKIKETRLYLETEVYEDVKNGRITQEEAVDKIIKAKMNPPLSQKSEYFEYRH